MYEKQIEVEVRAIFDEEKYKLLYTFLDTNAKDLGEDDKDVYFYLLPNKVIKSVNNISKKTAKIVMKLNRVGKGGNEAEEIEIQISPSDFPKAVKFFSELEFDEVQQSFQKRKNYMYKDVEIALKYSDSWGYHMELEIMVDDKSKQENAEKKLNEVANELGVHIMTQDEQKEFAANIDKRYKSKNK
jgi:predicted adenylyl cyclase CyaB